MQCIIGVGVAVLVTLPSSPSFMTVFTSIPLLTAHVVLALLLIVVALYATVLAYRLHLPGIAGWEALATAFLLFASQEGLAFTSTQNNAYSLGMVLGFLGALFVQVVVIYRLGRKPREPVSVPAPSSDA